MLTFKMVWQSGYGLKSRWSVLTDHRLREVIVDLWKKCVAVSDKGWNMVRINIGHVKVPILLMSLK